jgi:hypothetical protein
VIDGRQFFSLLHVRHSKQRAPFGARTFLNAGKPLESRIADART